MSDLELIRSKIYEIRGRRVMLDFDLAELYGTETKRLKEAVRRNLKRFPPDFMFELAQDEFGSLRTQFATSNNRGGTRYMPFAFTEQGVAMLSTVLNSDIAIEVNINIMRAFVAMREYILTNASLSVELANIRERVLRLEQATGDNIEAINDLSEDTRKDLDNLYNAIGALSAKTPQLEKPRRPIGYDQYGKKE